MVIPHCKLVYELPLRGDRVNIFSVYVSNHIRICAYSPRSLIPFTLTYSMRICLIPIQWYLVGEVFCRARKLTANATSGLMWFARYMDDTAHHVVWIGLFFICKDQITIGFFLEGYDLFILNFANTFTIYRHTEVLVGRCASCMQNLVWSKILGLELRFFRWLYVSSMHCRFVMIFKSSTYMHGLDMTQNYVCDF